MANLVLFELRQALGLSRPELAAELGLSRMFVWQVEVGRRKLGAAALVVGDRYGSELGQLGLSVEDLLRGQRGPRRRAA